MQRSRRFKNEGSYKRPFCEVVKENKVLSFLQIGGRETWPRDHTWGRPKLLPAWTFERCSGNIQLRTAGPLAVKIVPPELPLVPPGHGADISSTHLLEDADITCQT